MRKCPFCGCEASFWTREATEDYQALIIDCKVCPANMVEWVYKYDKNFAENFEKKKAEMFEAWNSRIERTAKVKYIVHTHGYPDEGLCGNCNEDVNGLYDYCPYCGAKLDWSGNE